MNESLVGFQKTVSFINTYFTVFKSAEVQVFIFAHNFAVIDTKYCVVF